MITENLSTLKIHKLTQEQYDRALASGNIDKNALYLTTNENAPSFPPITAADAGKFLRVSSEGKIIVEQLTNVSEVGA